MATVMAILDFRVERFCAIFELQITPYFLSSFESIDLSVQTKKFKTDFQDWISDRDDFSYFWYTSQPDTSYQVSSQLVCRFSNKSSK